MDMTVLAGFAALVAAAGLGYVLGRRHATASRSWKRRTSRIAVGKLAINLLLGLAARRVLRSPVAVVAASVVARARIY